MSNCLIHWPSHECCPQTRCSNLSPFFADSEHFVSNIAIVWELPVKTEESPEALLLPGAGKSHHTVLRPSWLLHTDTAVPLFKDDCSSQQLSWEPLNYSYPTWEAATGPQHSWYQPERASSQLWDTQALNPDLRWLNKSGTKVPYIILFLLTKHRYCLAMKSSCRNARSEPINSWGTERSWVNPLKEQKIRSAGANWQKPTDLQSYVGLHQLKILLIPVLLHSLEIV